MLRQNHPRRHQMWCLYTTAAAAEMESAMIALKQENLFQSEVGISQSEFATSAEICHHLKNLARGL